MPKRLNLKKLSAKLEDGAKLSALTAYDATMAALIDELVDIILVGDSLGMVVQGHPTTLPVRVSDMVYHTRAVCQGSEHAFIIADIPFLAASDPERALRTAGRLLAEGGAQMVKLECSHQQAHLVERLAQEGIPVCAHIGYRPQSVHMSSHYFSDLRLDSEQQTREAMAQWSKEAGQLIEAGADMLLLECVPAEITSHISANTKAPVIGIGSGDGCDGQILVLYDLFGLSYGGVPGFVKKLDLPPANLREIIERWKAGIGAGDS